MTIFDSVTTTATITTTTKSVAYDVAKSNKNYDLYTLAKWCHSRVWCMQSYSSVRCANSVFHTNFSHARIYDCVIKIELFTKSDRPRKYIEKRILNFFCEWLLMGCGGA